MLRRDMGRISELRQTAQRRTTNIYDTLFTRRVSIYVTLVLGSLGVSANAVSAANVLVAIGACCLIGLGSGWQLLLGVGLVHLFAVLDSVDGELARLRRRFTLQGLFLEDLAAYTMIPGFFLAIGAYLQNSRGLTWPLVAVVAVIAVGRNGMQVARRAMLKSIATRRPVTMRTVTGEAREASSARRFVEKQLLHYTNIWVVLSTLVVIEVVAEPKTPLVLYALVTYLALVMLKEAAVIAVYAATDALDRELLGIYERARTIPSEAVSGTDLAGD